MLLKYLNPPLPLIIELIFMILKDFKAFLLICMEPSTYILVMQRIHLYTCTRVQTHIRLFRWQTLNACKPALDWVIRFPIQ